jgi:acetyl esterase/lipase
VKKIGEVHAVINHIIQPALRSLALAFIFASSLAHAQAFPDGDITPGAPAPLCTSSDPLTLAYVAAGSGAQSLDLYLPASTTKAHPTVIWIHSGGWYMGDKTDVASARRLVCKGYAVASINYRLSGDAKFPAQIHDVKAAIRFLRANASAYNLDVNRFASFGSSAGGHLSSLVGTIGNTANLEDLTQGNANFSSNVRAAIAWFGPSDFAQMDAQTLAQGCSASAATHGGRDSNESNLLGCTVSDPACAAKITSANPATYVNATSAPMLFMHGTRDCFVPVEQSSLMKSAMEAKRRPASKRLVVDAEHGGAAWETVPVQDVVAAYLDFILKRSVAQDLSGDGKADVVFQNTVTGQIGAWLMNGTVPSATGGLAAPGGWSVSHNGDFNNDGKADIVFRNADGSVMLWLMNGLNRLSATSTVTLLGADPNWQVSHVGDFNGDGKSDILWRNINGAVTLWLMDGTTVTNRIGLLGADPDWRVTHLGDFNNDGKADLLWRNSNGATTVWLMNGGTIANATGILGADANWRVSHVGDFDGDGKSDLLWRNINGAVTMWLMNGSAIANAVGLLGATPDWSVTHTGDFNGDGRADILWRNNNGAVTLWLMSGSTVTSATGLLGADANLRVTHLGDYNGDGNADLVWRNTADGSISIWLMSAAEALEKKGLLGAGPWRVQPPAP